MTISSSGAERQHYCSFYVGQKVVCIRTVKPLWAPPSFIFPEVGGVYTVAELSLCHVSESVGLRLAEIDNPICSIEMAGTEYHDVELMWEPSHFRPLTDISVLQEIARTAKLPAGVPAREDEVVS